MRTAGKNGPGASAKPSVLLDAVAIFCLLLAPYLSFIRYNEFIFEPVNYAVVAFIAAVTSVLVALTRLARSPVPRVAALALALFLFLDFQFYWIGLPFLKLAIGVPAVGALCWLMRRRISFVLAAASATIVASTIGLMLWTGWTGGGESPADPAGGRPDRPVYVHIILDELAGPESFDDRIPIQKAVKDELQSFFIGQGFRLYGRAYSPYFHSSDSITALLNLETVADPSRFYEPKGPDFWITQNRYFDHLRAEGYGIKVYQSNYMDFCSADPDRVQSCLTYNFDAATSASLAALPEADKARIILTRYGRLYGTAQVALSTYGWLRPRLASAGLSLPKARPANQRLGPIPVMPVFDRLIGDVAADTGGYAYFAHLFIPHHPYSMDAACRIRRPVLFWQSRYIAPAYPTPEDAAQARLAHYTAYIQQIRCALEKVKEVIDALKARGAYDRATIVVHGDHGSRIVRHEPTAANRARLTAQDINDGYLALYAVKAPGIAPGYDDSFQALPSLMRSLVRSGATARAARPARVYLRDDPDTGLVELPIPCLADEGPRAVAPATPVLACGHGRANAAPAPGGDG